MDKVASKIYNELIDLSNSNITTHALMQYNTKCFPQLSFIEVVQQMREKMKSLQKVDLKTMDKKLKKYPNSQYFIDVDEIIYVIKNNKVITTYPNERIFMAKPYKS